MTYNVKADFVNNLPRRYQIQAAIVRQAIFILDGGGAPSAALKANASKALDNPELQVTRFAWYCAFDGTIDGVMNSNQEPTDTQIQAVVDAKAAVAWSV